jgi:oligopeptide/dipeptide ABC transporter ATP-binding protein
LPTKPETLAGTADEARAGQPLLSMRDLEVHFQLRGGNLARLLGRGTGTVKAVDGVNLELRKGEVLGVVGESGSGKSTLGRAVLGLARPTGGQIVYNGRDITGLSDRQLRSLRRELQMIFQDPNAALNPSMNLGTAIGHPLKIHGVAKGDDLRRRVVETLERVGLAPGEQYLSKLPGDLSGGQKQRAVIARAVILDPVLMVADEPISMLDMSVRAKILQLMLDLKRDLDLTYIYITHDLASAKFFCDRVAIMYLGRIVEIGATKEIFADPKHPYTQSLLKAIPDPGKRMSRDLPRGEIPDAASPPLGCSFHPRCPKAFEECGWESRDLRTLVESHWLRTDEATYEQEREAVGDLAELDSPGHRGVVPAAKGRAGTDVRKMLDRIRSEDPREPLWTGVRETRTLDNGVEVDFYEGEDPRLRPAGGVEVACHLY